MHAVFSDAKVLIVGIISVTLVVLAFIGALVWLALNHGDPATLLSLIATLVSVYNLYLLRDTRTAVTQVQAQTNGQMSKMLDANIASAQVANAPKGVVESNAV
jgi:hypothetical protein